MRSIVSNQCVAGTSSVATRLNGHAVCGPAVARSLVVDVELDASARDRVVRRPFWLTEACPVWCDATGTPCGHANHDAFEDRQHTLFGVEVELTLYPSAVVDAGEVALPALGLMVSQHYLAAVPLVALSVPLAAEPGGQAEEEVRLTVAEARELRDGLTALLDTLDGAALLAVGGVR